MTSSTERDHWKFNGGAIARMQVEPMATGDFVRRGDNLVLGRSKRGGKKSPRFDLLIIDEFGFDKIGRAESSEAVSLLYKAMDSRSEGRSIALVTDIDLEGWGDLGNPPLAMALLDRVVDGATILKIQGKSYCAHRARKSAPPAPTGDP